MDILLPPILTDNYVKMISPDRTVRIVKSVSQNCQTAVKMLSQVAEFRNQFQVGRNHLLDLCCVSSDFTLTLASGDTLTETARSLWVDSY